MLGRVVVRGFARGVEAEFGGVGLLRGEGRSAREGREKERGKTDELLEVQHEARLLLSSTTGQRRRSNRRRSRGSSTERLARRFTLWRIGVGRSSARGVEGGAVLAMTAVLGTTGGRRDERSRVAREVVAGAFDVGSECRRGGSGGAGDVAL